MSSLNDLKRRIVDEIPISDIVGNYIPLTRKGTSTIAVCPFHQDTKPSMHVTNEKRYFKCFACGEGGNAIDFVMKYRNVEFMDAMKEIAEKSGINFDDYVQKKQKSPKLEMAERILKASSKLYRKYATTGNFEEYNKFIVNRGLNEEVAATYNLGYAPKNSVLSDYLNKLPLEGKDRSMAFSVAEEIGLIRRDQKNPNSHYDTFRDRVIFPIWDQFGHVLGYTSRAVFDYQKAKYMNSKESFVFNKRNILYGLHLAKQEIRNKEFVLLVEGNMDQVALYSKGFKNAVAVMGTALGDNSLRILKSITKNFYLALDSDNAGYSACERINRQFMEQGFIPKYLNFEPHKDPDDYLQNEGSLALQKLIDEAPTFLDYHLDKSMPEKYPELLDRQLELLKKCFEIVAPLGESLEATERLAHMAKKIGLRSDSSQILKNYQDFLASNKTPSSSSGGNVGTHAAPQTRNNTPSGGQPPMPMDAPPYAQMGVQDGFPGDYGDMPPPDEAFSPFAGYDENPMEGMPSSDELNALKNDFVPLTKTERTLLQELVQQPDCLTRKEIAELLDFVGSDEVKRYILRLKELVYEIDDSEYAAVVANITRGGGYSDELIQVTNIALAKFSPLALEEKIVDRLLFDIKKRLQEDKLKMQKQELKFRKAECNTQEEMNALMLELLEIDKQLNEIKSLKPTKK